MYRSNEAWIAIVSQKAVPKTLNFIQKLEL